MSGTNLEVIASDLGHAQADIAILQQKVYLGNRKSLESRVGALENYREATGNTKNNMAMWVMVLINGLIMIVTVMTYLRLAK